MEVEYGGRGRAEVGCRLKADKWDSILLSIFWVIRVDVEIVEREQENGGNGDLFFNFLYTKILLIAQALFFG